MAVVEGTFLLRSTATAELKGMRAEAFETERAYIKLGATMDSSMAKGSAATKGAVAQQEKQVVATDAGAAAATRSAAQHEAAAKRTTKAWSDSGSAMVKMGKLVIGTIAGVAVATTMMATKYEAETKRFVTQTGLTQREADKASRNMLKMAGEVGQTPQHLAEGFYHVSSAMNAMLPHTQRVHIELGILREAAKGAAIGGSNLEQTAYALSSAMNALGRKGIGDAKTTMAELNAVVGTGDMRMGELVKAMSTGIVGAGETFGVTLHSMGAALAYMVDRGEPAQRAATRLRMAFTLMAAPTKKSAEMLRELGLDHHEVTTRSKALSSALEDSGLRMTDLAHDLRQPDGIFVALSDLKKHMTENGVNAETQAAVIAKAFGGGRMGTAIMNLYNHLEVVSQKYAQQTKVINSYDQDWAKTQETLTFQLHQAEGAVEAVGIKIGEKLIPKVEKGLQLLKDTATWFAHNQGAAESLAYVLGTVMVASVTALTVNIARKLFGAAREFYNFGKSIANLPATIGGKVTSVLAGGGETAAASTVAAGGGGMAMAGIRSMSGWGSYMNPLAVVTVDSFGTPVGVPGGPGMAAERATAVKGEQAAAQGTLFADPGQQGTLFATGSAGGAYTSLGSQEQQVIRASRLATIRNVAGMILGKGLTAGMSGGMAFLGTQLVGGMVGGTVGHDISGAGAGAGVGAALGSLLGVPWLGALIGGGTQAGAKLLGAHGSGGDILAGAGAGAAASAPLAAFSGVAAPAVLGLGAILGAAGGAFTGSTGSGTILKGNVERVQADLKANKGHKAILDARVLPFALGEQDFKNSAEAAKARDGVKAFMAEVDNAVATQAGQSGAKKWAEGFQKALAHGESPQQAVALMSKGIKIELDKLGPTGRLSFSTALATWIRQVEHAEPQLAGPMHELSSEIVSTMHGLGQKITVVNGQILTGSEQQWQGIAKAITDPASVALEKLSGTFGQMRAEALGALTEMGYSPGVARGLLKDLGSGPAGQQVASEAVKAAQKGQPLHVLAPHGATGMRVPGPVGPDSVGVFGHGGNLRGVVAPGELLVANRHTEARVDGMLSAFGTSLGREVAGETTPHYATGGVMGMGGGSHYARLIAAANKVSGANFPYRWGGGHEQPAHFEPFDCSGAVSYAVQQAGYPVPTVMSGNVPSWRFPAGAGAATVFYNPVHTFMRIGGKYWGTSGFARPGGGAGWFDQAPAPGYLSGFSTVHLPGLDGTGSGLLGGVTPPPWKGPSGILGAIGVSLGRGVANAINAGLEVMSSRAPGGGVGGGQGLADVVGGPGGGKRVGASYYGGPGSSAMGYRGDNLKQHPDSYAELNMGHALGGLPYMAPLRVKGPSGKSLVLHKRDIGKGGGAVKGYPRAIDLWYEPAGPLGVAQRGLAVVDIQKMSLGGALPAWGGWHKDGGSFVAKRPTYIGVGDGGEEEVDIRPRRHGASHVVRAGDVVVQVHIERIENNRPGDIAKIIHEEIEKLAVAIEQEHNSVPHQSEAALLR